MPSNRCRLHRKDVTRCMIAWVTQLRWLSACRQSIQRLLVCPAPHTPASERPRRWAALCIERAACDSRCRHRHGCLRQPGEVLPGSTFGAGVLWRRSRPEAVSSAPPRSGAYTFRLGRRWAQSSEVSRPGAHHRGGSAFAHPFSSSRYLAHGIVEFPRMTRRLVTLGTSSAGAESRPVGPHRHRLVTVDTERRRSPTSLTACVVW